MTEPNRGKDGIQGEVSPGFEPVATAFADLFESYGEIGAGVSVYIGGEQRVKLWGGSRDKAEQLPWESSTRSNVFSANKAMVAVAVLQLAQEGHLDLDQSVASLWPAFGQGGKNYITVRQVLCHRSGVNAFRDRIDDKAIYHWPTVTELIAQEEPWWEPGSAQGYSPMLYGWLLGELVCRVSGVDSFDHYIQERIAGPLDLDWDFGLDDDEFHRIADVAPLKHQQNVPDGGLVTLMRADPRGVVNRAFSNPPTLLTGTNKPAWRQAQIPAANGHASAEALARFYSALTDPNDERLLKTPRKPWCWEEQTRGQDRVLNHFLSFSLGFMRLPPTGIEAPRAFCHPGAGGSLGYGDMDAGLGFGFVSRAMGQAILMDERAEHLLAAVYRVLRA
ncbi:beta-lactamase family protein [Pseudomaricurvus alkylphenolicus]|uniref:serine hydrolase domain-containing protein n=1 Tax=Pseudomaricurvus alkylphenolicus TaxID=1306991 RepID=UPI00141F641A|nr:serine hydrolase domain-containing protein [Pseudomaricurvus alkylphenolicus]NIB42019.1 beta-lactamase family protein [Pseudomaricurvus alkylphenolicus]